MEKQGIIKSIWKGFQQNKLALAAFKLIVSFMAIALIAGFLANDKPIAAKHNGQILFPAFKEIAVNAGLAKWNPALQHADWKNLDYAWSVFPPIPYLPNNIDYNNIPPVGPFDAQNIESLRWRHWLGTDALGRDVLSGIIHGIKISLGIGLGAMFIALILGLFTGILSGYYGDSGFRMSRGRFFLNLVFLLMGTFMAFVPRLYILKDAMQSTVWEILKELGISFSIIAIFLVIANVLALLLQRISFFKKRVALPVDLFIQRLIELKLSIPIIFLFIAVIAVTGPSANVLILLIGFTAWTGIARFLRAEILREKELAYIEAARALGYSNSRIIFKHLMPNVLSPVFVTFAFGVSGAILAESSLSFLGLGVSPETVTWGSLMASSKQCPTCWWLAVFPGIMVFLTVYSFYLIGEGLSDAANPRLKKI
ncbi:MAG: ABC transporter permease [Bacteroidetes bacterium]|nr:ABC transporter permease [Bacteroidota bacterium]